jgi:hypothetical protein
MNPPNNSQLIKAEIADYWLSDEGILYSYSKKLKRTVKNITGNIALVKQITGGKKIPLLFISAILRFLVKKRANSLQRNCQMYIQQRQRSQNRDWQNLSRIFFQCKKAAYSP